ncbi:MerR family transcriptional regulator [Microbacterium koreense]|uniref:MerR family transcriptional regulator n=1 Tax=Microbacterium koreense TaxID=323761 RepID=A0ABW2ZNZ8_9MICO
MNDTEWSIQQLAKIAGTTSRTLRHYDEIGLLPPSRIAHNGYRHYDDTALVRLQRILLLRQLGLGLPQIADILARQKGEIDALESHLAWLQQEKDRLDRQIASVRSTITARKEGERLMAENVFDGFDHTQYKEEVQTRWGADAYRKSDEWWRALDADDKSGFAERTAALSRDWTDAAGSGIGAESPQAQELARRHVDWLCSVPGTPAADADGDLAGYVLGLGDMYVADPRFAANYGGVEGAEFVRDALRAYVARL